MIKKSTECDLPEPLELGKCENCRKRNIESGRLCRTCIRDRIRSSHEDVRDLNQRGTEQIGRSSWPWEAFEGCAIEDSYFD